MILASIIYLLIHALITLRMTIACIIYKILYNSDSGDSEYSFSEMVITVLIYKIEINPIYVTLCIFIFILYNMLLLIKIFF